VIISPGKTFLKVNNTTVLDNDILKEDYFVGVSGRFMFVNINANDPVRSILRVFYLKDPKTVELVDCGDIIKKKSSERPSNSERTTFFSFNKAGGLTLRTHIGASILPKVFGTITLSELESLPRSSVTKPQQTNAAMTAPYENNPSWQQGGIDLNTSSGMQWKVSKDGKGVEMNIDPAMIERVRREGIDSLSPVILRITPVASIWPLVGLPAPA
jgi:hypothetical protein